MMTDDDSETSASETQAQDESDLPVFQLCGLVEELRYPPPDSEGGPYSACGLRGWSSTEILQVHAER